MKKLLLFGAVLAFATAGMAAMKEVNGHWVHEYPAKSQAATHGGKPVYDITYHGGSIIQAAHVVPIFWGSYFSGTGASYATAMVNFFGSFGTTGEYNTITQYYDTVGTTHFIQKNQLTDTNSQTTAPAPVYDTHSEPPVNVTDAIVQSEVNYVIGLNGFDNSAIYEVFIPSTSYSSDGTSTSCGGPHLAYCAYHGSYTNGANTVKYSIEPYPNCSGCSVSGWSAALNAQHFACHETREAVTDPVNAWWDGHTGYEADDKCAWSPTPFVGTGGFGYQYEWSNETHGCVKTR
jgi:hypothetical protein